MSKYLPVSALVSLVVLAGCMEPVHNNGPTQMIVAHPTQEAPVLVSVPPPPPPPPQQLKQLKTESVSLAPATADIDGVNAADDARQDATRTAKPGDYINAIAVYDFNPGEVYHIYTSPDFVTTIALRRGEHLIAKIAGDTTRWTIGDTTTGDDITPTILVAIKPIKAGLRTNLVLTTTQRVYFLDLESRTGNQYQSAVSWNYPLEDMITTLASAGHANQQAESTALTGVSIEDLNYNYHIHMDSGPTPDWFPKEVFDDGKKTYIDFPETLGTMDAPPLFIRTGADEADLVNYRVKGHFYVVDRLFDHAELRIGKEPQIIVMIDRNGVAKPRAHS